MIVTACEAFRLTVSEDKTEIMFVQTKATGRVPFTVPAAGHVYKQTAAFVCLGETISADRDLRSVEVILRLQRAGGRFRVKNYENLRPPGCSVSPEGVDAQQRGNRDATVVQIRHEDPEK